MHDEPHQLLVGPRHALAGAPAVTPVQLADHRIWMPGMAGGAGRADNYEIEIWTLHGRDPDAEG